jgi:hypothetical protein
MLGRGKILLLFALKKASFQIQILFAFTQVNFSRRALYFTQADFSALTYTFTQVLERNTSYNIVYHRFRCGWRRWPEDATLLPVRRHGEHCKSHGITRRRYRCQRTVPNAIRFVLVKIERYRYAMRTRVRLKPEQT